MSKENTIKLNKTGMQESEATIRRVLDALDTMIYVSDIETDEILFVNDKMAKAFGSEELKGKICWQVFQKGFTEACSFCPCKRLKDSPKETIVWEEHNTVTGQYYKNTDSMIEWDGGKLAHIQNSLDITELKTAQMKLESQLATEQILADISMDFASLGNYDEKISNALKRLGKELKADELALVRDFDASFYGAQVTSRWIKAGEHNKKIDFSGIGSKAKNELTKRRYHVMTLGDGNADSQKTLVKSGIASALIFPIFAKDAFAGMLSAVRTQDSGPWTAGEILLAKSVSGIFSAVFERETVKSELESTKNTLRELIDNTPSSIFWTDKDGTIAGCNEKFANFMHKDISGVVGIKNGAGLPASFKKFIADDKNIWESKLPKLNFELELESPSGKGWFDCSKVPILNEKGEVTMLLCVIDDITVKKRQQLEIIERDKELERVLAIAEKSDRAKSEFLSRMSHEIRTPMNAIIGMTHIAQGTQSLSKISDCLKKIDDASVHLLAIINDILDMSRIEEGKMKLEETELSIDDVVTNVINVMMAKADEKQQTLSLSLDRQIPKTVKGDPVRLAQVLTNLVSNAIKFSPLGGNIKVNVLCTFDGGKNIMVKMSVTDNGIGMTKEQVGNLFIPFEQADISITRKYGGTGLGLAISKSIVELMGGTIGVKSEAGKGSEFTVEVPFKLVSAGENKISLVKGTAAKNLRILIVDDNMEVGQIFLELMKEYKIAAKAALSGREALSMLADAELERVPYSIVFIDWLMPEMDGVELAQQIKQRYPDIEIVMISMSEWTEIEPRAKSAGIAKFLPKPLYPSMIINTINEIVRVPAPPRGSANYDFSGKTIMIVEDVEVNKDIVVAMLEPTGAILECVENGLLALERFMRDPSRYSAILMDINMPVMDGYEATKRIRAEGSIKAKTIPIIAMTANVFNADIIKSLSSGMNEHIGKPIDDAVMLNKLAKYLSSGQKRVIANLDRQDKDGAAEKIDFSDFLPYINVEEGLSRIRGNKKLYASMLTNFRNGKIINDMKEADQSGELDKLLLCLHSLKGVSGNLALSMLFDTVTPIETLLKSGVYKKQALVEIEKTCKMTAESIDKVLPYLI